MNNVGTWEETSRDGSTYPNYSSTEFLTHELSGIELSEVEYPSSSVHSPSTRFRIVTKCNWPEQSSYGEHLRLGIRRSSVRTGRVVDIVRTRIGE